MSEIVPIQRIENKIYVIRGQKVMLDLDLAYLYGVPTKRLNEQVKRNIKRFPDDFMFQLTWGEAEVLRSQIATLNKPGHTPISKRGKHIKYLPNAFTEQGVAMLSSVLNSERAIQVNIAIMRVFARVKNIFSNHKELAEKFRDLERKVEGHDEEIKAIFAAIRRLMLPPESKPKRIGFNR